jgi:hypothetical protein
MKFTAHLDVLLAGLDVLLVWCPAIDLQVVLTSAKETSKRVEGADAAAASTANKVRVSRQLQQWSTHSVRCSVCV